MSAKATRDLMQNILIDVAKAEAPKLTAKVMDKLVASTAHDSIERTMATLLKGWVKEHGTEVAADMLDQLHLHLRGKDVDVAKLGLSARELTELTDRLQDLEEKAQRDVQQWARVTGVLVARFGRLLASELVKVLV